MPSFVYKIFSRDLELLVLAPLATTTTAMTKRYRMNHARSDVLRVHLTSLSPRVPTLFLSDRAVESCSHSGLALQTRNLRRSGFLSFEVLMLWLFSSTLLVNRLAQKHGLISVTKPIFPSLKVQKLQKIRSFCRLPAPSIAYPHPRTMARSPVERKSSEFARYNVVVKPRHDLTA